MNEACRDGGVIQGINAVTEPLGRELPDVKLGPRHPEYFGGKCKQKKSQQSGGFCVLEGNGIQDPVIV